MVTGADSPAAHGGKACVFLDRDGTLIEDAGYVHRLEDLKVLPNVPECLAALRRAGLLLIVVTNQSGVARGYYGEAQVERFHAQLSAQLGAAAAPDAYYYCPFHPDALEPAYRRDSPLRKPDIGMFASARRDFAIAAERSFMVGDKPSDIEFAQRAGMRGVQVTGLGTDARLIASAAGAYLLRPDFVAATRAILEAHEAHGTHGHGRDAWSTA
jgi:D-glycero-D-manno-heptose 1,7-bisphosphate phosphatase